MSVEVKELTEEKKENMSRTRDKVGSLKEKVSKTFTSAIKRFRGKETPHKLRLGRARVISVVNQKGGVGKTTTAVNLSACLAEEGKDVLLVDIDPQGNATSGVGLNKSEKEKCIYNSLIKGKSVTGLINVTPVERLEAIPATIQLVGAEVELVPVFSRETRLEKILEPVAESYDYIIIDCPPSLGLLTINGLVAADKLLIPIQCEYYALEGLGSLWESYRRVKRNLNPALEISGILMTMYDGRAKLSRQVVDDVSKFFRGRIQGEKVRVYKTIVPRTVKLSEAPSFGQPITEFDSRSKGAKVYRTLAKEVIKDG